MGWYHKKAAAQLTSVIDANRVQSFVKDTSDMRYHIRSVSTGIVSPSVGAKTILKAIENGHHDIELWVFVNPLYKTYTVDFRGAIRGAWEHNGRTQSFVIDYDNLVGIDNINDFKTAHKVKKMPMPFFISQTGPNSFHSLYLGKYGEWPESKRLWLLYKWAGITETISDKVELYNQLLESGIDTNYYVQGYGKHKMRVPGSINANHVMPDGSFWVVKGWLNTEYDSADKQYYEEVALPRPNFVPLENVVSITSEKPLHNTREYDKTLFVEPILAILNDLFPEGFACVKTIEIAKMLSSNVGWLVKNDCRVLQSRWAELFGCEQFDISRLLRRLIEKNILVKVDDNFCPNRFAKTYGAGDVLRDAIGWVGSSLPQPEWVRWDDGTSNQRMLYDIRYFVSTGMTNEEMIMLLHERQDHRPLRKKRPTSSFLTCIESTREWNRLHSGDVLLNLEEKQVDWWL